MHRPGSRSWIVAAVAGLLVLAVAGGASAQSKLRVIVIAPFDASGLEREEQWMGEGIAQILGLGLAQHASIVQIERGRLRAAGRADAWTEPFLAQAARAVRADAAVFGRIERRGTDLAVVPQLMEIKQGGPEVTNLEPVVAPPGELFGRLAALPGAYVRTLHVATTDAEGGRIEIRLSGGGGYTFDRKLVERIVDDEVVAEDVQAATQPPPRILKISNREQRRERVSARSRGVVNFHEYGNGGPQVLHDAHLEVDESQILRFDHQWCDVD